MQLNDLRIFVIEDEALVAMNLEDMLMDLGCRVVGTAMQLQQAEKMLADGLDCDAAIIDVNLAGELIYPFAQRLHEGGIPLVFATGYGQEGLPVEWRVHPVLQKPYTDEQVGEALKRAISARVDSGHLQRS